MLIDIKSDEELDFLIYFRINAKILLIFEDNGSNLLIFKFLILLIF